MQPLEVSVRPRRSCVVVTLRGELDLAGAERLSDEFREAFESSDHVIVDLDELAFIDSSGLAALIDGHKRALENGARFTLVAPRPQVEGVFTITGLVGRFDIRKTLDEALPPL
ncbi:STAS domain-containing protein [Actinomadura rupiterrae]|uniref:STAS domain-containing protein n=1 Tax=Actinomadura rupiterrae TaxID=559627 RepID=UPI0020A3D391|nr:STAS domain-containing protein [Actinomadura rupiterrae]MCP2342837.1 anti-sigma B factor antagonist [Actinomadura rupiterrae]